MRVFVDSASRSINPQANEATEDYVPNGPSLKIGRYDGSGVLPARLRAARLDVFLAFFDGNSAGRNDSPVALPAGKNAHRTGCWGCRDPDRLRRSLDDRCAARKSYGRDCDRQEC